MKIHEIISEAHDFPDIRDQIGGGELADDPDFDANEYGQGFPWPDQQEPEMELSSKATANKKIVNAILKVCDKLKGEGNSRVDLLPFITQVSELAGKVVKLADLIAVNKSSPEIQRIVDSIDEKSVKFKNTSVKNEDPSKAKDHKDATVGNMAGRAATRNRQL